MFEVAAIAPMLFVHSWLKSPANHSSFGTNFDTIIPSDIVIAPEFNVFSDWLTLFQRYRIMITFPHCHRRNSKTEEWDRAEYKMNKHGAYSMNMHMDRSGYDRQTFETQMYRVGRLRLPNFNGFKVINLFPLESWDCLHVFTKHQLRLYSLANIVSIRVDDLCSAQHDMRFRQHYATKWLPQTTTK